MNDPARVFLTSDLVRLEVLPKPLYFRWPAAVDFYEAYCALVTARVEASPDTPPRGEIDKKSLLSIPSHRQGGVLSPSSASKE
jgi:hypothetical protein